MYEEQVKLVFELYKKGKLNLNTGQYDAAIENYNKIIEICPSICDIYNNIGMTKFDENDWSEAVQNLSKSIELSSFLRDAVKSKKMAEYLKKLSLTN
jgi:tetratricopeptide (TPR) repeat protein